MVWDMVEVALSRIMSEEEVARLSFAASCRVLRAEIAVLETPESHGEHVVSKKDVKRLQRTVRWFDKQWGVGWQFEARLADLMKRLHLILY